MSRVLNAISVQAAAAPNAQALVGDRAVFGWSDLRLAVLQAGAWLEERLDGHSPDSPVAIALDNGPAWVILDLALILIGRPCLPLPPFFTADQARHALESAGACLLLRPSGQGENGLSLGGESVAAQALDFAPRPLPAGVAKITFTSGSTGAPKGVCLSHSQMEATAGSIVQVLGSGYAGRHLGVLPLGVLLENVAGLYSTMIAGGCYRAAGLASLGFADGLHPQIGRLIAAIIQSCVTSVIMTPELLRALTAALRAEPRRLPSLRVVAVGGSRVSTVLHAQAQAAGLPVCEGYGLSECGSVVALNMPGDRAGRVGRILPHLEASIADDGEVRVGPHPFLGYVGEPAHAGPVMTGDIGSLDDEGYLAISGRKSNLLITTYGRNVSPEWVESELTAEREIRQAVVFGDGQAELCAILVGDDPELRDQALGAAVARTNARLPVYARIGRWMRTAPFDAGAGEVTPNGRPQRARLAERHHSFIAHKTETL